MRVTEMVSPQDEYRKLAADYIRRSFVQRGTDLTLDNFLNPYGCTGLFDPCANNNLISLSMCGVDPFMDALGWTASTICRHIQPYLTWAGDAALAGGAPGAVVPPSGIIADCCDDRPPIAYGTCEYEIEGFGHLGNSGGTICIYDDLQECATTPARRRLDGTVVDSNVEFRALLAAEVILQTLRWMIVHGDSTIPGHFDGLNNIIITGRTDRQGNPCPAMDSMLVTWNDGCYNELDATWTDSRGDQTIPAGNNIIDVIYCMWKQCMKRKKMSPMLAAQGTSIGDMFIAGDPEKLECLLDCLTCKVKCQVGDSPNEVLWEPQSQEFLESLRGGNNDFYGFGFLRYKNMRIPLVGADYLGDDLYFITRRSGSMEMLFGEYQDMANLRSLNEFNGSDFSSSDDGRFLHYMQHDNTCLSPVMDMRPRIQYPGSWCQGRIIGFQCDMGIDCVPSCNPWSTDFYFRDLTTAVAP